MSACLFCRIVAGEIPSKKAGEGPGWLAFHDVNPQAPAHVLVVPKRHIDGLDQAAADPGLLGEIAAACASVARTLGLSAGYRVVANQGAAAGQSVMHLHFHVLGGRSLAWPPG